MQYDSEILFSRVREIRAGSRQPLSESERQIEDRMGLLAAIMECGPEAGRKCLSRSHSHYGLPPRGLVGHRYPNQLEKVKKKIVKDLSGNEWEIIA